MKVRVLFIAVFLLVLAGLIWLNLSVQADITRVCHEGGYSWTWRCSPFKAEPTDLNTPT